MSKNLKIIATIISLCMMTSSALAAGEGSKNNDEKYLYFADCADLTIGLGVVFLKAKDLKQHDAHMAMHSGFSEVEKLFWIKANGTESGLIESRKNRGNGYITRVSKTNERLLSESEISEWSGKRNSCVESTMADAEAKGIFSSTFRAKLGR